MPSLVLAQANLAWMRFSLADPRMADFVAALEAVNRAAEAAPGFVWRLQTPAGDSTGVRVLDDPHILFNLSLWRSPEDLFAYTYRSGHGEVFARRRTWFREPERAPVVMWWVAADHRPDVSEALERFERLWAHGPGPGAFAFASPFHPDGTPYPPDWRRGRPDPIPEAGAPPSP